MKRFLYHDLIVAGNFCNLKCSYCTSVADAGDFGDATSASARRRGATIAVGNVLAMVDGLRRHVDAPAMKLSRPDRPTRPSAPPYPCNQARLYNFRL